MRVRVCMYVYIYVCVYCVWMYTYAYIYICVCACDEGKLIFLLAFVCLWESAVEMHVEMQLMGLSYLLRTFVSSTNSTWAFALLLLVDLTTSCIACCY